MKLCIDMAPSQLCTVDCLSSDLLCKRLTALPTHSRWVKACHKTDLHLTLSQQPLSVNFARVWRPTTNGFEHFVVRAPSKGLSSRLDVVGPSRKRTSGDGLALAKCPLQPSQLVRIAQATARGRRMPGAGGAMSRDASESTKQQRVPYRKAEGRILGTSHGDKDPLRTLRRDAR